MPSPSADAASRTDLADCVCLAGPTASGKSAAALAVAAALERVRPVEIVSVDSALVYRGMDIGTAKPTPAERARVPHHLIDLIDPAEAYSAARFVADAGAAIAGIHQRGHLPLLVGGTMLYFKAVIDGIDAMPAADPKVRAALEAHARRDGWAALHAELGRVDPATASRLAPGDSQRIQRALEVFRVSGRPLSSFHHRGTASASAPPLLISLEPDDRAWLHDRIERRFGAMLDGGLVEEVRALRQRGDLRADLPSMRCVGYRQVWAALDTGALADLHGLTDRGTAATRQLAKRQLTWLRSMPWRRRVACDAPDAPAQVVRIVRERLLRPNVNV